MIGPAALRVAIVAAALCCAAPALACSYSQAPEPVGHASAEFFAARMGPEASFVDVAVAESTGQAFGAAKGWPVPETRFRVLFRLKGESADRFSLYVGELTTTETLPAPQHFVDEAGRVSPFPYPHETALESPYISNSCDAGMMRVRLGQAYLVYREADGRLLKAVPMHDGRAQVAFPIVPVSLNENIGWLQAAMAGIGRTPRLPPSLPSTTVAGVRFAKPLNEDEGIRWAARAGVAPAGIWIERGRMIEEYRVPVSRAGVGLISHAFAELRTRRSSTALRAQAAELLKESDERFELDNLIQLRANLLIESAAAEPPEGAQGRIVAMEVSGPAERIARLGSAPNVAQRFAGIVRRGANATEPMVHGSVPRYPHQYDWKRETGASVRSRLQAVAEGGAPPAPKYLPPEPPADPFASTGCIRIGEAEALALGAPLLARFGTYTLYGSRDDVDCVQHATTLSCQLKPRSAVRLDSGARIGGFRAGPDAVRLDVADRTIRCARTG